MIGIGTQGAHGAISPTSDGIESQYLSVAVADAQPNYERALAAGARVAKALRDHGSGAHAYEALALEGHRGRFVHQRLREAPPPRS